MLISQLVPFGRQQLNIVDVAANLAIVAPFLAALTCVNAWTGPSVEDAPMERMR